MNKAKHCLWGCLAVALLMFLREKVAEDLPPSYLLAALILLLGCYGAWCAFRSISGINRLLRHFRGLSGNKADKERFYPKTSTEEGSLDVEQYCRELTEWLKLHSGHLRKESKPNAHHFVDRVEALVVTQNTAADKGVDINLPGVNDLASLTEMKEQSHPCVVGLNVTISFLLILGILGTLVGIHACMAGNGVRELAVLKPALVPSAFAVGITVLLMIAKGIYQVRRAHYMAELNLFTLLYLIPHLQRDAVGNKRMDDVQSGAEGLNRAVRYVGDFTQKAENGTATLKTTLEAMRDKVAETLESSRKIARRCSEAKASWNSQNEHAGSMAELAARLEGLLSLLNSTHEHAVELCNRYAADIASLLGILKNLNAGLRESNRKGEQSSAALRANCNAMEFLPARVASIRATEDTLDDTNNLADALLADMRQRHEKWSGVLEELSRFRESAEVSQKRAGDGRKECGSLVQGTEEFLNDAAPQALQGDMDRLTDEMKTAAGKMDWYGTEILTQNKHPMLYRAEWIVLFIILAAVVVKIILVYV